MEPIEPTLFEVSAYFNNGRQAEKGFCWLVCGSRENALEKFINRCREEGSIEKMLSKPEVCEINEIDGYAISLQQIHVNSADYPNKN